MRRAFTIIELLVVITIIVVLLALLTLALDKAIYQSELTLCAANQDAIVSSTVSYAIGNKRRYPYRPGVEAGGLWSTPLIYNGDRTLTGAWNSGDPQQNLGGPYDDRIILGSYLSMNAVMNDPLADAVDYDDIDDDSHAYAAYNLFMGYQFAGFSGMKKVGDRLAAPTPSGATWRDELLVSDRDATRPSGDCQSGHPDDDGIMTNLLLQNGAFQNGHSGDLPFKMTVTMWFSGAQFRGNLDMNYGYQDGSVRRLAELAFRDERMTFIPVGTNTGAVAAGFLEMVPPGK